MKNHCLDGQECIGGTHDCGKDRSKCPRRWRWEDVIPAKLANVETDDLLAELRRRIPRPPDR